MLDIAGLERTICTLYGQGLAQSTTKAYASGKKRFIDFCMAARLDPLPLTERTVCLFVAHLAEAGLQPGSVKSYLAAIRHMQISAGLPDPSLTSSFPRLSYMLKGIQRSRATTQSVSCQRLPITPQILAMLRASWNTPPVTYDKQLLWAACCVGFRVPPGRGVCSPLGERSDRGIDRCKRRVPRPVIPTQLCADPPSPVQDRPLWSRHRHLSGTDRPGYLPSCRHTIVPDSPPGRDGRPLV